MKTSLDWSRFEAHAILTIGRVPIFREQLSRRDLLALGFIDAANAAHLWNDGRA
jgi:hypothetical protein